jgi:hypothetical protein
MPIPAALAIFKTDAKSDNLTGRININPIMLITT